MELDSLAGNGMDPFESVALLDQQAALHHGILHLPELLRRPMVLRYLLGRTNEQVATELSISHAAVEGRLKRAKLLLRARLIRQGVMLSSALATWSVADSCSAQAGTLMASTIQRCLMAGTKTAVARTDLPGSLAQLVTEELNAMMTGRFAKLILMTSVGAAAAGLALVPPVPQAGAVGQTVTIDATAVAEQPSDSMVVSAPAALTSWSLRAQSPPERQIQSALQSSATFEFFDTSLRDALDALSQMHQIQFAVDQAGLDEIGVTADATVNAQFENISLNSGLTLMLRPLGLTYIVRDEVLTITTPEVAQSVVTLQLYPYDDRWPMTIEQLSEAVTKGIEPESWAETGGPGYLATYSGGLMVTNSYQVHAKIRELLEQLSRQATR
jgi:hypothetical protein